MDSPAGHCRHEWPARARESTVHRPSGRAGPAGRLEALPGMAAQARKALAVANRFGPLDMGEEGAAPAARGRSACTSSGGPLV